MITRTDFADIDKEVKDSIEQTLKAVKQDRPSDYILLLADGEFNEKYDHPSIRLNPYVIDSREDQFKDETRLNFLTEFLTVFYSFPSVQVATDDSFQRMNMELMIYTHIWESQPFLKRLYRLAHIANSEHYEWDVKIPEMGKHDFIRNNIRQTFEDQGNHLAEVIRRGFHTSLRNAFAHSEYFFDTMNGNSKILLTNYKGTAWELSDISFDDWSKRFVYSAFLSYYLLSLSHQHRVSLIDTFGTDELQIKHPTKDKSYKMVWIKYRKEHDTFNFLRP